MPVTTLTYNTVPVGTTWEGAEPFIAADPDYLGGTANALSLGSLGFSTTVAANLPNLVLSNPGRVFARYNVESELNYDWGRFFIDGVEKHADSGSKGWQTANLGDVAAGSHTFRLTYSEDYAASVGFDNLHVGSVYVIDGDISNLGVTNLSVTNNGTDAIAYWTSPLHGQTGFTYEWTIDGGTNVYSTTNPYITIPGLTYNTTYTLRVRPVYTGYGNGAWTDTTILLASYPKPLGSFRSEMWSKNNTQGTVSDNEVIVSNGSNRVGAVVSRITMPITDSSFSVEFHPGAGADRYDIGVVSPGTSESAPSTGGWASGLPSQTSAWGFTGFSMDIWASTGVTPYINGVAQTGLTTANLNGAAFYTYEVRYSISGGNITIQLYRAGTLIHSATGTAPPYTMGRPAIGAGSAGISSLFKVRGTPAWNIVDLAFNVVSGINAYPLNNRINYIWDKLAGATSYEYSLDGGTTPVSTGANNFVKFTGLSVGDTRSPVFRAKSSTTGTQTGWSAAVPATTTAIPTYDALVLDRDPIFYVKMDEGSGAFRDSSSNFLTFTSGTTTVRGLEPLNNQSTQSVITSGTSRQAIAYRPITTAMQSATLTAEMWVKLPADNHAGTFFKIGDQNGWGIGVGNFGSHGNLGRNLIGITEGVAWQGTAWTFANTVDKIYHLVMTRNNLTFTYYIDGVQIYTHTATSVVTPTVNVTIGGQNTTSRVVSSTVKFDSVTLYPTVLTQAQVQENYRAGSILTKTTAEGVPLNGGIAVRWPASPGATSYEYSTDGGTTTSSVTALPNSLNYFDTNSASVTGLTNGTSYNFIVRARSAQQSNPAPWSDPITVTPSGTRYVTHWDDFNRATSTTSLGSPQVGGPYTAVTGTWGITADGRAYNTTGVAAGRVTFPGSYEFDATFEVPVSPSNFAGLGFRYFDVNNSMMLYRNGSGANSNWRLWTNIAGSSTDIFVSENDAKETDIVRVVGKGSTIYVYRNGQRLTSREDPRFAHPASTMSLYSSSNLSSNGYIDNVVVWNTADFDPLHPDKGTIAHVYKGRDNYNDDLGNTP